MLGIKRQPATRSVIGAGMRVQGPCTFSDGLQIDGEVLGDVTAEGGQPSVLVIGDTDSGLPELPDAKKARFVLDYGVTEYDAGVLTADVETARWFEVLLTAAAKAQVFAQIDLLRELE